MHFDLIIRNGVVVDGTGNPAHRVDVAVIGDCIAALGHLGDDVDSETTIDARGHVVAPGFIDIHTHSDVTSLDDPSAESKILQGVTTDVTGNCGFSPFPTSAGRIDGNLELMAMLGPRRGAGTWTDLDAYAVAVGEAVPAINLAPLVGHGALRVAVAGTRYGALSARELDLLVNLLEQQLEQGAFGMSTGLTYVPSMYATATELVAMATALKRWNRLYATHARYTAGAGLSPMTELAELSRDTGVRAQYSHIALIEPSTWGLAGEACRVFEQAVAAGDDVAFDLYPYEASSSNLTQYLPAWVADGGIEAMRRRLADVPTRARAVADVARGWFGGIPWDWDTVVVSRTPAGGRDLVGRSIAALADGGRGTAEVMVDLCDTFGNELQVVLVTRRADDVATFLAHPLATLGSDGFALPLSLGADAPHPRSFGVHARWLGRYVRSERLVPLESAIAKLTSRPAQRLGITDRGVLAVGLAADIVVFDSECIQDTATFDAPARPPIGVNDVVVNGCHAVAAGRSTGRRAGRLLRAA
jgi:N-acyl-D-aspartate/D-glutamate deacylase